MLSDVIITQKDWDSMNGNGPDECMEWTLGISVAGHGGSICLLRDGNVAFFLKEERSTRIKRDCESPFKSLKEIKKYTNEIDLVVFLNVTSDNQELFLTQLEKDGISVYNHLDPNEIDSPDSLYSYHHINHASCGYHLSPFVEDEEDVIIVVMDGWGYVGEIHNLFRDKFDQEVINSYESIQNELKFGVRMYEHVSIFHAPSKINEWELLYKEVSSDFTRNVFLEGYYTDMAFVEEDYKNFFNSHPRCENAEIHYGPSCSTPVLYEAITQLIGFDQEDVGKTMGMAPYGKPNKEIPKLFVDNDYLDTNDTICGNLLINTTIYPEFLDFDASSDFQNRADVAFAVQKALEKKVIDVVEKAMSLSDSKKIVLSGGTFHNIIINEILASKYPEYTFFSDPICDDAGHSYGGAIFYWKSRLIASGNYDSIPERPKEMYLGPDYSPEEQLMRINKWFKKSVNK